MKTTFLIEYNRDVDFEKDYISEGSFTVILSDGSKRQFDFIESSKGTYYNKHIVETEMKNLDETYMDGDKLTIEDISNIVKIEEFFIGIGDDMWNGKEHEILVPKKIISWGFSDYDAKKDKDIVVNISREILKHATIYTDHNI